MTQAVCKLKKLLKSNIGQYVKHVSKPKSVCVSCGRVANCKKMLCKPIKIKTAEA